MHGRRSRPTHDLVDETMQLAREVRDRPLFEMHHLAVAALVGFALALVLRPRPRHDQD
jgi:hypothetical protein